MKEYEYPKEFEELWSKIPGRGKGNNKETGYKLFLRMKDRCACPDLEEQIKAKNKWIAELLEAGE